MTKQLYKITAILALITGMIIMCTKNPQELIGIKITLIGIMFYLFSLGNKD